jgi:diphosphomevalonate decarboxylase
LPVFNKLARGLCWRQVGKGYLGMSLSGKATVRAHPNIAFIKYWGNADNQLRLPANSSISMNLDGLYTETRVEWHEGDRADQLILNGVEQTGQVLQRVSSHLDIIRQRLGLRAGAMIDSVNNFPTGAGIASSASGFAALTVAAVAAAGANLAERELTTLARRGSGSAARSIPAGFVEWHQAATHEDSYAETIAAPDYWDIVDIIAVISMEHKAVGSSQGHQSALTSDLQQARLGGAAQRIHTCRRAILERDFTPFAEVVEHDSNLMHAVMMTSRPPLFYWLPSTLVIMEKVRRWRADGLNVCYTLDAGPNVHCICVRKDADQVSRELHNLSEVMDVRTATVGGGAQIINKRTDI